MTQPPIAEWLEARRLFASGDLDPQFNSDGVATATFGEYQEPHDVVVQADSKSVVVGSGRIARDGTHTVDFALARFRANGTLDPTFGAGGKVLTDFGGSEDVAYAAAIQPDQNIVVAGKAYLPRGDGKFGGAIGLARYLPDGSLDLSFGGGRGTVTVPVGALSYARSVVIQPDGKILVAGSSIADTRIDDSAFAVARFNPDGTLDTSFVNVRSPAGTPAGVVVSDWTVGHDHAFDLVLDPDGRIVVSGETGAWPDHFLTLARYLPDGALDRSFDGDGVLLTRTPGSGGQAVGLQSNGHIVAAGQNFNLSRFRPDGTPDRRAGDRANHNVGGTPTGDCTDLLIQLDDKVVLVGQTSGSFTVVRLLPDLGPDRQFATTDPARPGKLAIDLDPDAPSDTAVGVALAPDGRIVAPASRWAQTFVLARLQNSIVPQVKVTAEQPAAAERGGGATFRFTRPAPSDEPLEVTFHFRGSAEPGLDYETLPGSVTIPAGERSVTLQIRALDDRVWEPTEFVTISLRQLVGEATASITDDDARPPGASISGRLFDDADRDGLRGRGERDIAGRYVFTDLDGNGGRGFDEPFAISDAFGFYTIKGVAAGVHAVRTDVRVYGWRPTRPPRDAHVVESDGTTPILGKHFGYTQDVYATGALFHDRDADGQRGAGEPPIVGEVVYVDYNGNDELDTNEPSTVTRDDGTYEFDELPAGWLPLRTGRDAGPVKRTFPKSDEQRDAYSSDGGTVHVLRDFGYVDVGRIEGSGFADQDGNAAFTTGDYAAAGFRVFLDRNGDGAWTRGEPYAHTDDDGRYALPDIPTGTYRLRVALGNGWRTTGDASYEVTVDAGGVVTRDFAVTRNVLITGIVFMDANWSGARDDAEDGIASWTVFVDVDGDGELDDDEPSVLTDADGRYAIATLAGGTHQVRAVAGRNYRVTTPPTGSHVVSLLPGATLAGVDFGQKRILR